ncbi:hypothetical protein MBANPS3_008348 [Mucor bainieri]
MSSKCSTEAPTNSNKRKYSTCSTSTPSDEKSAGTGSSSTSTVKSLTSSSYLALSATFESMSDSMKWKLKDDVYVEDLLYDYAKSREKENIAHSFVINLKDT